MRWGISNGGKSARALGEDLGLEQGEVLYEGDMPGNQYDEFDTGLVIDAGVARVRNSGEVLAVAKAAKIAAFNAEAQRRIYAKWPAWKQANCALGLLPPSTRAQCEADIVAVIGASNAASDLVDAATIEQDIGAVTVQWPAL